MCVREVAHAAITVLLQLTGQACTRVGAACPALASAGLDIEVTSQLAIARLLCLNLVPCLLQRFLYMKMLLAPSMPVALRVYHDLATAA